MNKPIILKCTKCSWIYEYVSYVSPLDKLICPLCKAQVIVQTKK